jgi:hypothetical protein
MDQSPHSFTIDLDEERPSRPVPPVRVGKNRQRVTLPDFYPKYELEFFETVAVCADYIDKISDVNVRLKFHNDLNRIFILRHKPTLMRLFRDLVNLPAY